MTTRYSFTISVTWQDWTQGSCVSFLDNTEKKRTPSYCVLCGPYGGNRQVKI